MSNTDKKPCSNSRTCPVWVDRKKPCPHCGKQVLNG